MDHIPSFMHGKWKLCGPHGPYIIVFNIILKRIGSTLGNKNSTNTIWSTITTSIILFLVAKNMRKCMCGNVHLWNSIVQACAIVCPSAWFKKMFQRNASCDFNLKIRTTKLGWCYTILFPSNNANLISNQLGLQSLFQINQIVWNNKWWP